MENITNKKVPVTVLTGFLGSGKTTLLNRILSQNHGKRIAVIENEFGEIGVDNELVIGADEEIFEMNNGCICCTVRGDLIRILNSLMKRKDKFDYIMIETTGMADPAPVAQTFFVDEEMSEKMQIDSITTLVDARHVLQHIEDSDECMQQIAFADVILLNKIDLVTEDEIQKLEKKIRGINAMAKIYKTQDAAIAMDKILNVRAFDLSAKVEVNPEFLKEELPFEYAAIYKLDEGDYDLTLAEGPDPTMDLTFVKMEATDDPEIDRMKKQNTLLFSEEPEEVRQGKTIVPDKILYQLKLDESQQSFRVPIPEPGHYILFSQHHADEFDMSLLSHGEEVAPVRTMEFEHSHEHDAAVSSVGIDFEGDLDQGKFSKWISFVLQTMGVDIFRSKGILCFANHPQRIVFQGVHMLFDAKPERMLNPGEKRKNQIVFIGRNLDRQLLTSGFKGCLA